VIRRRFPVGVNPTRQRLQPEASGAVTEVTKWLKPSDSDSQIGDSASVQTVTRVNAEQASKRSMRRPTRLPFRGGLISLDSLKHTAVGSAGGIGVAPPDFISMNLEYAGTAIAAGQTQGASGNLCRKEITIGHITRR
jgi:hypothetical protein